MLKIQYNLSTPLETLRSLISQDKPLFVDFETYNDSKHYKGKFYGNIRLAQFMQEGWSECVICDLRWGMDANKIELLRQIIHEDGNHIVGQNFAYDFSVLQEHSKTHTRINLDKYTDTLLLARELFPLQRADLMQGRYSLDDVYLYALGYDPYEAYGIDKAKMQKSKWNSVLGNKHYEYAGIDVFYMPQLWKAMKDVEAQYLGLCTEEQREAYHTRFYNAHLAVDVGLLMQDTGLVIDKDLTTEYFNKYDSMAKSAMQSLKGYGVSDTFNPTSPKQVKELLGLENSDKTTLSFALYRDNNEIVKHIMEYRKGKSRSSTVKKWAELTMDYGKVQGHFSPTTTTGRFSSSQENMQNQPRDSKTVFKAPEHNILIGFDYAQIELRTMCALTGDDNMYRVFRNFGDIHTNTQELCGISIRNVAKQVNFGNLYGMGVPKFQELLIKDGIYMEIAELQHIKDRFLATYSRIPEYHEIGVANSKAGRPNYSLLGHPYFSKYFNQMNNLANQASGTSEVAKMFFRYADEMGLLRGEFINLSVQIHDSNLFNYAGLHEYAESYAFAIGILAQKAWFKTLSISSSIGVSKFADIPMPVEVGVSTHWASVDDNIVTDLKGLEYYDNPKFYDDWLENFKNGIHKNNQRIEYVR